MAIQERSAGIIIVYPSTRSGGDDRFLLLDYGKYWDFAKGHVEKGESDQLAALRELREETGIENADPIEGFAHEIAYFFRSKRGLIRKSVMFFLAQVDSDRVILSEEHVGYAWLPFDAALEKLGFASAKQVLRAANDHWLAVHPQRSHK
jgi:bis(5'-nucleosidyl)-tetraphosphatase